MSAVRRLAEGLRAEAPVNDNRLRATNDNRVAVVSFNTLGNLNYRHDDVGAGVSEFACYDNLNRLSQYAAGTGSTVTACTSASNNKAVTYDALGNITSKTGVGAYGYNASGSSLPHAVAGIVGNVNGVVNPAYSYDANGNMIAGGGRTVTYTAFNMASSIMQGTTTVSLTYDSEHTRIQMTAPSGTTTYLNDPVTGAMEEKLVAGSTATWHDYIQADGHIVAEKFSGATNAVRYIVADHLGSTAIVTDETGAVVERDAYDAWGKRRNLDGSDDTTCSLTSQTTRGFTGHEHIDSECLINANARIYDPTLGRFMTADDEIPDLLNGQAFNAYSYVNNGPLSAVDPTGHDCATVYSGDENYGANMPCPPAPIPCVPDWVCQNVQPYDCDDAGMCKYKNCSGNDYCAPIPKLGDSDTGGCDQACQQQRAANQGYLQYANLYDGGTPLNTGQGGPGNKGNGGSTPTTPNPKPVPNKPQACKTRYVWDFGLSIGAQAGVKLKWKGLVEVSEFIDYGSFNVGFSENGLYANVRDGGEFKLAIFGHGPEVSTFRTAPAFGNQKLSDLPWLPSDQISGPDSEVALGVGARAKLGLKNLTLNCFAAY